MVDDGAHAGPRLVYGAMDEALGVRRSSARIDRRSVEPELHQVVELDALGRARARKKVAVRSIEMADAHVPERIDNALAREDPIGGDELVEHRTQCAHCGCTIT